MDSELLTASETAAKLKVHLVTIYKWIASGRLQAKRLPGGGLRIETKELDKLLTKKEEEAKSCKSNQDNH